MAEISEAENAVRGAEVEQPREQLSWIGWGSIQGL